MASFKYNPPTEFLKQLGKLSKIDEIAPKMVEESVPIVQRNLIRELAYHVGTGELQESIKNTPVKKWKSGGVYAVARPTGTSDTYVDEKGVTRNRSEPIRNMEKLAYLEYGRSGQAARPIMSTVIGDSEGSVKNKMQEVFRREVEK